MIFHCVPFHNGLFMKSFLVHTLLKIFIPVYTQHFQVTVSVCPHVVLLLILLILQCFSFLLLSEMGHFPCACLLCSYEIWISVSFAYLSSFFHHFMVFKYSKFCLQGWNNVLFDFLLKSFYVILVFFSEKFANYWCVKTCKNKSNHLF